MRKGLFLLAAMAVVALPLCLVAEDGRRGDGPRPDVRPPRPNPEVMFQRLDANQDGVITPEELPEGMPERLKQMLIRADENKDRQLTKDELIKAFKDRKPGPRPEAGPPQPQRVVKKAPQGPQARPKVAMHQKKPPANVRFGAWPGMGGVQPFRLDARAIFNRLDRDKDGKLSFEEFAAGLHQFRQMFVQRVGQFAARMPHQKMAFAWAPKIPSFMQDHFKRYFPTKDGRVGGPPAPYAQQMAKQPSRPFCPMGCPCCAFARHGMPGMQMPGMQGFDYRGPQPYHHPQWMMFAAYHPWQPWAMPWHGWSQGGPWMGFGPGAPTGKEKFQGPRQGWWGQPPKEPGKKPQFMTQPKPEPKKPERKPEIKDEAGKIKEIEARLTALEKQQAMLLAAVREVRMLLTEVRQEKQQKEVAKVPPKPKHRPKPHEERD